MTINKDRLPDGTRYAVMPVSAALDTRLSHFDYRVLSYLMSKTEDWVIYATHVEEVFGVTNKTARNVLLSLIKHGYGTPVVRHGARIDVHIAIPPGNLDTSVVSNLPPPGNLTTNLGIEITAPPVIWEPTPGKTDTSVVPKLPPPGKTDTSAEDLSSTMSEMTPPPVNSIPALVAELPPPPVKQIPTLVSKLPPSYEFSSNEVLTHEISTTKVEVEPGLEQYQNWSIEDLKTLDAKTLARIQREDSELGARAYDAMCSGLFKNLNFDPLAATRAAEPTKGLFRGGKA